MAPMLHIIHARSSVAWPSGSVLSYRVVLAAKTVVTHFCSCTDIGRQLEPSPTRSDPSP